MQKIKERKWVIYSVLGLYLLLSPFLGFPIIVKDALYVVVGAGIIWLSVIEPGKIESGASIDKKV